MTPIVEARGLVKDHVRGTQVIRALRGVDLTVAPGSLVAVHGRSGSGKTTLLNIIGGLDTADAGDLVVCGTDLMGASAAELARLRRDHLAFVFQGFGLLPVLSATENIEVPLRLAGADRATRTERVSELLDLVGLSHRADHRPSELSGGEQQRVAIARALAGSPSLLIADEPTGQLDSRTAVEITRLIGQVVRERNIAAVIATHDLTLIDLADTTLDLGAADHPSL
jgi:putative ABC transport system ATP-binding protein